MLNEKRTKVTYPIRNSSGELLDDDAVKCEEFRSLYQEIYSPPQPIPGYDIYADKASELYEKIKTDFGNIEKRPENDQIRPNVTAERIRMILKKVKNTSPGEDSISYAHIKHLPDSALSYIAEIFNACISCCYFPDAWKEGAVTLLPKANKPRDDTRNYRPITMLNALGKTFERIIDYDINTYLETNDIIPECQSGYRSHRSTQDQLLHLVQDASQAILNNEITIATMFDFEKAYDQVWHEGLILKLEQVGFNKLSI